MKKLKRHFTKLIDEIRDEISELEDAILENSEIVHLSTKKQLLEYYKIREKSHSDK